MNDIDYLVKHLDFLIGILEVSDETVYDEIKYQDRFDYGETMDEVYNSKYENYQNVITTSALILGFTYFEDFVTKMIEKILIEKPELNKKKFNLKDLITIGHGNIVEDLAKTHARKMMISEKMKLIKNNFSAINSDLIDKMEFIRKLRNCIIHENGHVDTELANISSDYTQGDKIILTASKVNEYGLSAREFANELWNEVEKL